MVLHSISEFDPIAPARSSAEQIRLHRTRHNHENENMRGSTCSTHLRCKARQRGVPRLAYLSQNSEISRIYPTHKSVSSAFTNQGNWTNMGVPWLVPCPPSLPTNQPLHMEGSSNVVGEGALAPVAFFFLSIASQLSPGRLTRYCMHFAY